MAFFKLPEFTGKMSVDKEQPSDFLLEFERATFVYDADTKLKAFRLSMGKGTCPARTWYDSLKLGERDTWDKVETLFKAKFPDTPVATKRKMDWEKELAEAKLDEEKLGKTEEVRGVEVYAHHKFAEDLFSLAENAEISGSQTLIGLVRDRLPEPIKSRISCEFKDWREFTDAIKAVSAVELKECVQQKAIRDKELKQMQSQIAQLQQFAQGNRQTTVPDSPTKALRTGLANFTLRGAQGSGQGKRLDFQPLTAGDKTIMESLVLEYPVPSNDEEYRRQLSKWKNKYGEDAIVTPKVPFPLSPGTAPPLSGECFTCGKTGSHEWGTNCPNTRIPERERKWRVLCNRYLRTRAPIPVRSVEKDSDDEEGDSEEFSWLHRRGTVRYEQGKGSGSFA